ncbi:hypothetical protein PMAYCL1PPCAC_14048, partial [Pristionchus mayeri]
TNIGQEEQHEGNADYSVENSERLPKVRLRRGVTVADSSDHRKRVEERPGESPLSAHAQLFSVVTASGKEHRKILKKTNLRVHHPLPLVRVQLVHSKGRIPRNIYSPLTSRGNLALDAHFVRSLHRPEDDGAEQSVAHHLRAQSDMREEE